MAKEDPPAGRETGAMGFGDMVMPIPNWPKCSAVESAPGRAGGAWFLKGTRMPVSAVFENEKAGANFDKTTEWFDGLDRDQVKAVIDIAARSPNSPLLRPSNRGTDR
jgi:uncharacterized protein (DUF433 family)